MNRLEALSPNLVAKLRRAPALRQRAASLTACHFAVSRADLRHPLLQDALESLRAAEPLPPEKKAEVQGLVLRLDEEYFGLQEAAEQGRARAEESLRVFGQARAASAVLAAHQDDSFEAAAEAIYEACAVTDEPMVLLSLVEAVLE